jgi:hypothetical protein
VNDATRDAPKTQTKNQKMKTTQTKIEAINKINAAAPQILSRIHEILNPSIGKKILVQKPWKTWGKKLQEDFIALHEKMRENQIRIVFHFSDRSIWADIDTTIPCGQYSVEYVKQSFSVARIEEGNLVELTPVESLQFRTDYTEKEIADKMQKLRELRDAAFAMEGEIPVQLRK